MVTGAFGHPRANLPCIRMGVAQFLTSSARLPSIFEKSRDPCRSLSVSLDTVSRPMVRVEAPEVLVAAQT
jgi:hypothetical protein